MIFIDANVPMYLVGGEHAHKIDARQILESLAGERRSLVTSSEVFQEILHRYVSIDRRHMIERAFDALQGTVDGVLPIERQDVLTAKDLVHADERLSARDALHVAVMRRHQISQIVSFDRGFDAVTGVERLGEPSP